jgi:UDP-N-acetylglucosamine 2-epimerase (non-hydrolysing)
VIAFFLGTRPEIIKCAPVIHELARRAAPCTIIHSGQHYTPALDEIFFEELALPAPAFNLKAGSAAPATQLARIISRGGKALASLKPRMVVVQGDTNTVLGGALAALKNEIPVAHLEAGMRSDDWTMPEEANRVLTGHIAALHFCPTRVQAERLAREGVTRGVHIVGNSIVDATLTFVGRAAVTSTILDRLELKQRAYAVVTIHRPSNVDDPARLQALLTALAEAAAVRNLKLVFPIHPKTRSRLRDKPRSVVERHPFMMIEPVGYTDMLQLMQNSKLILTDSGGIQEEACILHIPCLTLRQNTERPETVAVGSNMLCPWSDSAFVGAAMDEMLGREKNWPTPFGDGQTAVRVADLLLETK